RQATVDEALTAKSAAAPASAAPPAQAGGTGRGPGATVAASDDTPPTKDGANANANSKAVENLNSKVDKLIELLKKQ
ncbi:MAG TPA: hypothetical protein VE360_02965, partial [Pyrinomonadaceae bacterium]|nr:hypothetical protein [Pyrinomonadaceae bacterium]